MITPNVDQRALDMARYIHKMAGAKQLTYSDPGPAATTATIRISTSS